MYTRKGFFVSRKDKEKEKILKEPFGILVNLDKRTLDKGTIFSHKLGLFQSPAEFYFKGVYEIVDSFTDLTLSCKLRTYCTYVCTTSTTLLARLFTVPFGTVQSTYQPVLRACLDVLCANMADGIHGQKVFACAMLTV